MSRKEKLFEKFPPVPTKDWMDKITADLKGDDFGKRLIWKPIEGFEVKPFYRSEDCTGLIGSKPSARGGNRWRVRQNIVVADYSASNRKALDILMKGVDSLGFIIADPESVSVANFEELLKDIHFESIETSFHSEGRAKEILDIFLKILISRGIPLKDVTGAIEADPLGRLMLNGKLCISFEAGLDYLADLTARSAQLENFRTIRAGAFNFANAGGDVVQELAFGLAMGNEYMSVLTGRNISPDLAASKIGFTFAAGSNYFFEIAKLRAARSLWSLITKKYELKDQASGRMDIHCVTGKWNKTIYDPHANLLRTQTEAMSAALGGADSITVEPFDTVFRAPDEFSERIARNQQLLLKEESYFDRVADPAGGSYYIENLTSMIAAKAWELFIQVEEKGGFTGALKAGFIQAKLKGTAEKRSSDVSKRREILLGTNQYPGFNETIKSEPVVTTGKKEAEEKGELAIEPIMIFRGAGQIENLRMKADNAQVRPAVFMLTIGNPAMRLARSQFSCNFFGCGGYRVIDNPGFRTPKEGVRAAMESKAGIIVICSSDDEYAVTAPLINDLVAGKAIVVVAGNPPCMEELKLKGINYFISIRSDLVGTITMFHRLTGLIK
jgi:methylmalonyl-CoA mutase